MPTPFRIIDSGIRSARENIAFDQAMIDLHSDGAIPDTIRFLGFPPSVLIGRHQVLSHEVALAYCNENHIGVARRITGGGAIYFDEGQLGWSMVFDRHSLNIKSLESLAREICVAAAAGLSRFGIDARYRPRNDIEVQGRKISGTGGFFDGDTLFYQGTVLVDMDPQKMVAALRVPAAKLAKHGIDSVAARITTLRELLGDNTPTLAQIKTALVAGFTETLGITPTIDEVSAAEEQTATRIFDEEVGNDEFVAELDDPQTQANVLIGQHNGKGGTITCYLRLEGHKQDRIREILLTGDFFVTPPRLIWDLEARLRGVAVTEWRDHLNAFFEASDVGLLSATIDDFGTAIDSAMHTAAMSRAADS